MVTRKFQRTDTDVIGKCAMCGRDIYDGEKHYQMPDDTWVCEDIMCLEDWAEEYERH